MVSEVDKMDTVRKKKSWVNDGEFASWVICDPLVIR
jgi:hypothetical protein